MSETAVVLNASNDELTVTLVRTQACGGCRACVAAFDEKQKTLTVKNACGAHVNDTVKIELEKDYALKAAGILYGLPLIFTLTGVFLGFFTAPLVGLGAYQDIVSFVAGVGCMVLSYMFIKNRDKRLDKDQYRPVATAIVGKAKLAPQCK